MMTFPEKLDVAVWVFASLASESNCTVPSLPEIGFVMPIFFRHSVPAPAFVMEPPQKALTLLLLWVCPINDCKIVSVALSPMVNTGLVPDLELMCALIVAVAAASTCTEAFPTNARLP